MNKIEIDFIKKIIAKENVSPLKSIKISGYNVHAFLKQTLRNKYLKANKVPTMELVSNINANKMLESAFSSIVDIMGLLLKNINVQNVFFAFPRVDNIGGVYVDKFSDPYISVSDIKNYIIFENGRGGLHMTPRAHNEHIVNTDIIKIISVIFSKLFKHIWYLLNKKSLDVLTKQINLVYGTEVVGNMPVVENCLCDICECKIYELILKKIKAKNVFAAARPFTVFAAAKHAGAKTFEMQHGITYSETTLYSGYKNNESTPDYFLSFGDMKPNDVYGIDTKDIVNVGWPLIKYLKEKANIIKYGSEDFLVISEPEVSDKIIDATLVLAEAYPNSKFYIRPHPHELYTSSQIDKIHSLPNVDINNNKINIAEVMAGFENVIGENSTVMYEALSANKKVGKLYIAGLNPIYLEESDKASFWHIHSVEDLKEMLSGSVDDKTHKSIYSDFKAELFKSLLK